MARRDLSSRAPLLLAAVIVAHVLLVSAQVGTAGGPSLLRTGIVGLVTRLQEGSWLAVGVLRSIVDGYVALWHVREENARLARDAEALRGALAEARASASGTEGLRALVGVRASVPWTTTGARVVAGSASPDYRSVTIDKGSRDGVRRNMAVIAQGGVVGRVAIAAASASTVQFVVDRSAAVSGRVERTRSEGIALGNGDATLRFEYLSATADVQPDDAVVTAGLDGIYPAGLALGRVVDVRRAGPAYTRVTIKAAVDFSRLEYVLVIVSPRQPDVAPPRAGAEEGG
ncbi:MAG TPA: rod shape-determining protein MreC [Vicinamibacterales bacterium]|nr:rod shape-determining protein MreC [Vicinamibacterales bacterium]HPK72095.1 rod shape-determining protein MreC [Vicinamibacterales bacterium]